MSAPTPVEIVRPKRTGADVWAELIGALCNIAASAFVLMTLVPVFAPWHPSYYQAVAFLLAVRAAWFPPQSLDLWSRPAAKRSKKRTTP